MRFIHGHNKKAALKHGLTDGAEYRAYYHAMHRCNSPRDRFYADYGGRGIKFLFTSFEQFFAEVGLRPEGMTLDRKDNDGHYEPGNVRWATPLEQAANRRPYGSGFAN